MLQFFFYLVLALLLIFVFSPLFLGVPFLPTHQKQARKMIELAQIKPGMKVVDLGSGAGRLLFLSAKSGAEATGYELNPFLILWTKMVIFFKRRQNQVKVFYKSIYKADISEADVIFLFLYPPHMKKLADKIFMECKPGAKIVSYVFKFPERAPILSEEGIFVYEK